MIFLKHHLLVHMIFMIKINNFILRHHHLVLDPKIKLNIEKSCFLIVNYVKNIILNYIIACYANNKMYDNKIYDTKTR